MYLPGASEMDQHSTTFSRAIDLEADLLFIAPMTERAHSYTYDPPPGMARSNTVNAAHRVTVHDARQIAADLSLDHEGFELIEQRSAVRDFYDEDELAKCTTRRPSGWWRNTPAHHASSSSTTRSVAVIGAPRTALPDCHVSRRRACTTTIRSIPRHSASAT